MQKTVLITGGAGFVGSHLADEFLAQGYRVRVLDNLAEQVHGPGRTFLVRVVAAEARLTLHIPRRAYVERLPGIPTIRVFEAVGAGACLLCDYWPGLELFLAPGREVLVVDSGEAVAETLSHLEPAQARAMGEA